MLRKYLCQKGKGMLEAEELQQAMNKLECKKCKHYKLMRAMKGCDGPMPCASR